MRTNSAHREGAQLLGREALHSLGVLVPMQFQPLKVLPGRHPLGRSGDGMRLLRTRPFIAGEDNPRDIDKFSPPHERQVMEWEDEAQASVMLLADNSASMAVPDKLALRNACLLQLTYSLWRAGDRVGLTLFDTALRNEVQSANLRTQMERIASTLVSTRPRGATSLSTVMEEYWIKNSRRSSDLVFVVADFLNTDLDSKNPDTGWTTLLKQFHKNIVPIVISYAVPQGTEGVFKLWDPERKARRLVRFSADRVRQMNNQEQSRVSVLSKMFRSAGVDHITVSDQRRIYSELARLARIRRRRTA